ncbi:MAG TPA: hypothetical protein VEH84_01415 [Alphaproteobacteria bacterium]|nr:hypothetical protein [Alphaproteobacteria bacterium]
MDRIAAGAVAGLAATLPMTLAMVAMHRRLPQAERYPLPPSEILLAMERRAGIEDRVGPGAHLAATLAAHFAFGALAGAGYGALPRSDRPLAAANAFGLAVWTGSYLGWVPGLRLLKPATRHPARRNALMIAAHLVWGSVLGGVTEALAGREAPPLQGEDRARAVAA